MLLVAVILAVSPEEALEAVIGLIGLSLLVSGLRLIIYFITMAKNMVGGRLILYKAIILTDLGIFTGLMASVPPVYALFYLYAGIAFSGVMDIMKAFEEKKYSLSGWRLRLYFGVLKILIIVPGLLLSESFHAMVYIYCAGIVHSAAERISTAFRNDEVVYIDL